MHILLPSNRKGQGWKLRIQPAFRPLHKINGIFKATLKIIFLFCHTGTASGHHKNKVVDIKSHLTRCCRADVEVEFPDRGLIDSTKD